MKINLKKITREANFLSLAGNISISLFGIAGFAIMARSFSTEVFGEWVLFISGIAFVEMLRFGITNTAIVRFLSGSDADDRLRFIGSNGLIGLISTTAIAILMVLLWTLFPEPITHAGFRLFFVWFPVLAFINLPYNMALVIMQADMQFDRIFLVKFIESCGFFLMQLLNYLFFSWSLDVLVWSYLGMNLITSAFILFKNWDGLRHIRKATRKTNKVILDFGKYTTFTLLGTNLLRNADALIISLSPLGPAGVALYSIPMKLTELQQLPLRSFAATAFPKMSKASMLQRPDEVRSLFDTYTGALTILFVCMSLFIFIFADFLVLLLGGPQYVGTNAEVGANAATILRIFSVYGLLLPLDRMTGVGLDSINRPEINLIKVMFMVLTNVIGDLVAIFVFHSLEMVAVASVLFTLLGVILGYYYLNREVKLHFKSIFTEGYLFYKSVYHRFHDHFHSVKN